MTFSPNSFSGSPIKPSQEGWNNSPKGVSKRGSHDQPTGKLGFKKVRHDKSKRLSSKVESAKSAHQNDGESLTLSTESSPKKVTRISSAGVNLIGLRNFFTFLKNLDERMFAKGLIEVVKACEEKGVEHLLQIKVLDLSGLNLKELPEELGLLTNLETLQISVNDLTSLPDSLRTLSKLRCVEMGYNKFRELPPVICQIARERMANKKYFELYLAENPISEIAADLKPVIRVNPNYAVHFIKGL
ncbi:MAG: hypothetical protein LLG04_05840 [Parachlamydia sp.]|nr:hypothetical protein [Parachlamydia sp.]